MDELNGVKVIEGDFTTDETLHALEAALGDKGLHAQGVDVIVSDMAAPTMGHKQTDHLRIMHLAELALDFADKMLRPGGHFVAKLFMGGGDAEFVQQLKSRFQHVTFMKPQASRKESSEQYVVARNRKENT